MRHSSNLDRAEMHSFELRARESNIAHPDKSERKQVSEELMPPESGRDALDSASDS